MNKNPTIPLEEKRNESIYFVNKRSIKSILRDLIYLLKGYVLVANVFPVLVGFWLASYFTGSSLTDNGFLFLNTMVGSILVIAGALVLNNWYEVDLDEKMDRTQKRPTVTGSFSLNTVLTMGILFTIIGFVFLLQTTIEATIYGIIGWFTYVVLYTFWSKRKYTINTIIGAVSGAVTPLNWMGSNNTWISYCSNYSCILSFLSGKCHIPIRLRYVDLTTINELELQCCQLSMELMSPNDKFFCILLVCYHYPSFFGHLVQPLSSSQPS